MKKTIILGTGLFLINLNLQSQSDYVLTKNNDTIPVKVISWNDKDFVAKVKCEVNGQVKKFKAKDLIEFRVNDSYYEVCRVNASLVGFKKKMFLKRYVRGKISLYGINVTDHFGSSALSKTPYAYTEVTTKVNFIKKTNGNQTGFKKLFGYKKVRNMTSDCDAYNKKFGQTVADSEYPYVDQIMFYNENCN